MVVFFPNDTFDPQSNVSFQQQQQQNMQSKGVIYRYLSFSEHI